MTTTTAETIVACGKCGAKNRLKPDRKKQAPVCGKCRNRLAPEYATADRLVEITDQTFASAVERYPGPALVSFGAQWCSHSRGIVPALQQLAKAYSGRVKIGQVDVDANPATASRFKVRSTPTLVFFKGGRHVNTVTGALPEADIERHIQTLM